MSKISFEGGEITYKYLMNKSKNDLSRMYLELLTEFKQLQNTAHNNDYTKCLGLLEKQLNNKGEIGLVPVSEVMKLISKHFA